MYKVYIIIVLIVLTLMYLNNSKILNEPFADTSASYTDADKNKILQVLKDTYEVDALLNITQIAKGLQTDGYTVPGKLNVSGDLKTSGDLEVSGNIKIGKYSLTPNKLGNDEMLELKYTKDGTEQNNKTIARFGKEGGDKMQVCVNDDCSKFFFVNGAEPNLGFYNNKQGETGFIGKASVDNISTNNISTNNIKKLGTDQTRIRLIDNETNICGDADCNKKQFFVKYGEGDARAGIQSDSASSQFDIINNTDRKYRIKSWQKTLEIGPASTDNKWWDARIIYNPDGGLEGNGDKIFVVKANNGHFWVQKGDGGIGSFGKWASKGKCDKCDTRVKYCEKAGNPSECN